VTIYERFVFGSLLLIIVIDVFYSK